MNHISKYLAPYQIARAFYKGKEILAIVSYFASGRIRIIDHEAVDRIINKEDLIII